MGELKGYLKDKVLDNQVENERESLMQLLLQKAKGMGIEPQNTLETASEVSSETDDNVVNDSAKVDNNC